MNYKTDKLNKECKPYVAIYESMLKCHACVRLCVNVLILANKLFESAVEYNHWYVISTDFEQMRTKLQKSSTKISFELSTNSQYKRDMGIWQTWRYQR